MSVSSADVVICGAGLPGIAAAYHLSVKCGFARVVLVDEREPLSLTSAMSTECYRNWWPGPGDAMVSFVNRSIDMLEELARESDNCFRLARRGYLFTTADPARVEGYRRAAEEGAALGIGPLRVHDGTSSGPAYIPLAVEGFEQQPTGTDLITDQQLIRAHFPYLTEQIIAVLHVRRCGWLDAQALGHYMLEQAQSHGVQLVQGRVIGVDTTGGHVRGVEIERDGTSTTIATETFVNAAGPMQKAVGRMLGVEIPVFSELHLRVKFADPEGVVPQDGPLLLWSDPTPITWSEEERAQVADDPERRWLLDTYPAGVHTRPYTWNGQPALYALWTFDDSPLEPVVPPVVNPHHGEIALRGLATMLPSVRAYAGRLPMHKVEGGYYTKTRENRPLIGPLPVKGAYILGAMSGFGIMGACAAGELLAAYITGGTLPSYASAFAFERYTDPAYLALLEQWGDSGQL